MEPNVRPRAAICTLGCRVNQYESEVVESDLRARGFEIADFSEVCDVYLINTCAVTGESERKSKQMIRRAAATNPSAPVIVMGCFSQLHPEEASSLAGVAYVCGNRNKRTAAALAEQLVREGRSDRTCAVCDVETAPIEPMTLVKGARARVFVKIEDGCDNRCTYCIIQKARGKVVSRPEEEILAEVRSLVKHGCREVILTGIEAAAYGRDQNERGAFGALIAKVAKIDGVCRVRLGSLEPSVLTEAFCDLLAGDPHIMPSFHLSLQSGSDRVLAAMKRKYNRTQVRDKVAYLKRVMPGVTFSCDLIVGFPGETEEDFLDTMALAEEIDFLHMHVFPFSPREGTPAAEMTGQISESVKHERLHRLEALGKTMTARHYEAAIGTQKEIIVESRVGTRLLGHTAEMLEVAVPCAEDAIGEFRAVKILRYDGKKLIGEFV